MRLDKPIGTHLLFLPAAWSITIGAPSIYDGASLCLLFYSGAVLLRGAGCTVNDLWDQDIDGRVARTRRRPLPSGEVSTRAAVALLAAQLSAGLAVLLSLNNTSIVVGAPSVIPAMLYPLAKRMTDYPQAVLGLTFNWGALLGYAAAADTLAPAAFCLYGAGWCWTMIYDTIYAHQDKVDDARIGVRSSALALGDRTRPVLALLAVGKIGCLAAAGFAADLSIPYYAGIALTGAHVARQIVSTDLDDPKQCLNAFQSNATTGAITWASLIAGRLL
jgi:4-hydroxybenzoate polyprenyl transferase